MPCETKKSFTSSARLSLSAKLYFSGPRTSACPTTISSFGCVVLFMFFESRRGLGERLFLACYQAHFRMVPVGIVRGIEKARQRYWRCRVDRANDAQVGGPGCCSTASVGYIERVGHILVNRAGTRLAGRSLYDLTATAGHATKGLDGDVIRHWTSTNLRLPNRLRRLCRLPCDSELRVDSG